MLTPEQIRTRIEKIRRQHHEESCWSLLNLLYEVLPDLVAPPTPPQRPELHERVPRICPDCTPEAPCDRVRSLMADA